MSVLEVSPDPVRRVAAFATKYQLDFALLADEDHPLAEAYGVWVQKSMYGRTYMGVDRSTFVIAPDGRLATVLRRVMPAEHDALVLAELAS